MRLEVNISKGGLFILLFAIVLVAGGIFVFAYDPGNPNADPSVFGHSANEIEGLVGGELRYETGIFNTAGAGYFRINFNTPFDEVPLIKLYHNTSNGPEVKSDSSGGIEQQYKGEWCDFETTSEIGISLPYAGIYILNASKEGFTIKQQSLWNNAMKVRWIAIGK